MLFSQHVNFRDSVALCCPECRHDFMHHAMIKIWHRHQDAESGTFVESTRKETRVAIDHRMNDCPSPRRDAISILFRCEECAGVYELTILQHKGVSVFQWNRQTPKETLDELYALESYGEEFHPVNY